MKPYIKKKAFAASLACVALGSALCLTRIDPALAEEVISKPVTNITECERVLENVGNDLQTIVTDYNKVFDAEWTANGIEYSSPVYLVDDEEYGMYLDFDGNNGYAVVTSDNKICGLETTGDLDYLRDVEDIYFHSYDGFMYLDENKNLQKFTGNEILYQDVLLGSPQSLEEGGLSTGMNVSNTLYPGQSKAGDGKIDPNFIDDYVAARYPGYDRAYKYNDLSYYFNYEEQFYTSYYLKRYLDGEMKTYTEGNCSLNAMYNTMYSWAVHDLIDIPYKEIDDIRESILSDVFYSVYGIGTIEKDEKGSYTWTRNHDFLLKKMPVVYSNIRGYAISKGYKNAGGYPKAYVPETMEYVANLLYGNNIDVQATTSLSNISVSMKFKKSAFMSISGSSTYNNHAVAVVGMYKYSKEIPINSEYTFTEDLYFYEIADGHNSTSKIFDPNTDASPYISFCYLAGC